MLSESPSTPRRENDNACGLVRLLLVMSYDSVIVLGLLLIAAALASPLDTGNQQALRDPAFTLYLVMVWFLYLAICWRNSGMTVGMRAWRVSLHAEKGRPDWSQCLQRFLVSLVSAGCVGLGFAWMFLDRRKRTWHDIASGTWLETHRKSN